MELDKQYLLLSAVRGPDNCNDQWSRLLKATVTARIRAIIFTRGTCRGVIQFRELSAADVKALEKHCSKVNDYPAAGRYHYISHLIYGVRETAEHRIWGGHGRVLLGTLLRLQHNLDREVS